MARPRDVLKMETRRPISPGAEALLGKYFPVLDHGFVALVDYMGTDESIDVTARTTHQSSARSNGDRRRLLRRLYRELHTSPLEFGEVVLHMRLPIFVARQWVRHRTASISEMSGRYTLIPDRYYTPEAWRLQSKENKQGSSGDVLCGFGVGLVYDDLCEKAFHVREWLDGECVARELSRLPLPVSTFTEWRWKIDLHNLLHCLSLRCASDAQDEARRYANTIAGMVKLAYPIIHEAWIDYAVCGARMSRHEMQVIKSMIGGKSSVDALNSMSERERIDFGKKLERDYTAVPDHSLDIANAMTIEEASER